MYFYLYFFAKIVPFGNGFKIKSNVEHKGLVKEKDEQGLYFWYSPLFENLEGVVNFSRENEIYADLP